MTNKMNTAKNATRTKGELMVNVWTTGRLTLEVHGHGHPIAEILPQHNGEQRANADFLELAWNSHDALVSALKELMTGHSIKGEEQARKALQLAEKQ